jgi:hypothetical protein
MRNEHVIPAFFVSKLFEAQGFDPVSGTEYDAMTTVMTYLGAQQFKDPSTPEMPLGGDFSLIAQLRAKIKKGVWWTVEPIDGPPKAAARFKRAYRLLARGAVRRTIDAVRLDSDRAGKFRGPKDKPEPPTPDKDRIEKAVEKQQEKIDAMADRRGTQ